MDQILLPERFVNAEQVLQPLPCLRRDIRIKRIEVGDVSRLSIHDEEHKREEDEEGHQNLDRPRQQISSHRFVRPSVQ